MKPSLHVTALLHNQDESLKLDHLTDSMEVKPDGINLCCWKTARLSAELIYHRKLPGKLVSIAQNPGWFLLPSDSSTQRKVECLFERPVRF
jgi:hypothetical protein